MRELFPVDSESTETSLVLRTEDGEEFFLSITDELREALQGEPVETPEEEPAAPAISLAKPTKRRRKAVTPHWEDVLLGVRSNTKRPRD